MRPVTSFVVALLLAGCGRPPETPAPESGAVPPAPRAGGAPKAQAAAALLPPALAGAARPTCALIDPEKDPRVAVLEAQLLADPGATWVERGDIDAVLKEQKLQALFSPEGVGDRVRLGKLLKADLLVMVRPARDVKEPALEVVVAETAGGLRLAVRGVPVTADPGADAAGLAAAVRDGVLRGRQPITAVVAVPPFVSHDLGHELAHCRAAYARLAEAVALARPGVVAVELAEADALGTELALTPGSGSLVRPLPVYLLGEYRHDGPRDGRTATLDLRAEQGGKASAPPARQTVPVDGIPAALRGWVDGALDAAAGGRAPADPKAEARLLVARAATFERLGNWAEAAALLEAALLLDPGHLGARGGVLGVLTRQLAQVSTQVFTTRAAGRQPEPEVLRSARAIQLRGLDHLDAMLTRDDSFQSFQRSRFPVGDIAFLQQVIFFARLPGGGGTPEEAEMRADCGAVMLRTLHRLAPLNRESDRFYVDAAIAGLDPAAKYAWVEQLALRTADLPGAQDRTRRYVGYARSAQKTGGDEAGAYAGLLARLEGAANADVRAAAADLRRQAAAPRVTRPAPPSPKTADLVDLGLRPLSPAAEADGGAVGRLTGIQAAGPGVDVLWGPGAVYVMKTRGAVRPVWTTPGALVEGVRYDGRYAWAVAYPPGGWPRLLVIDPVAEKAWLTADGLPEGNPRAPKGPTSYRLKLAPVGPGRACVVGSFGQTWVAVATFDPGPGRVAVRVIHEAREAQVENSAAQADQTTVDFVPQFAHVLTGTPRPDGGAETRVLVGRGGPLLGGGAGTHNQPLVERPLVIDPGRGTVAVLRGFASLTAGLGSHEWVAVADGVAYGVRPAAPPAGPASWELVRMGVNDLRWTAVGPARSDPLPERSLASVVAATAHDGRLYYVAVVTGPDPRAPAARPQTRYEFWSVALDGTGARQVIPADTGSLIPNAGLYTSSHYGVVVSASTSRGEGLFPIPTRVPNPR